MFAGNFAPSGWMLCAGQLLPISEYETLFQLIGTTYGGDGQDTFALPNLQGRIPIHQSPNNTLGTSFGSESVTLITSQIPIHNHVPVANGRGSSTPVAVGSVHGRNPSADQYTTDDSVGFVNLNTNSVLPAGGNQPHDNMMPFLCVNFIISMFGIFPSPS